MEWQKGKSLAYLKECIRSLLLIRGINGPWLGARDYPEKRGFARVDKEADARLIYIFKRQEESTRVALYQPKSGKLTIFLRDWPAMTAKKL